MSEPPTSEEVDKYSIHAVYHGSLIHGSNPRTRPIRRGGPWHPGIQLFREVAPAALAYLRTSSWPGNVRELRNSIERAVILSRGEVLTQSDFVLGQMNSGTPAGIGDLRLPAQGVDLHEIEAEFVRQALQRTDNNQTKAAKLLHLSRDQLRYRMEKLGLL